MAVGNDREAHGSSLSPQDNPLTAAYVAVENVWGVEPPDISHTITYNLDWEVPRYLHVCGFKPGTKLGDVLTITGDGRDAQASSCREYISQRWPAVGDHLLDGIEKMLASDGPVTISSKFSTKPAMILSHTVNPYNSGLQSTASFQIKTTFRNHQDLAAAISWLCAVIRRTSQKDGISTSQTTIFGTRSGSESDLRTLSFQQDRLVPIATQSCWHYLFSYTVVAFGFPIRDRPSENGMRGKGLEIALKPLLELSNSRPIKLPNGGLVLEGISVCIHPTKRLARGDMQLHLELRDQAGNFETGKDPSSILESLKSSSTIQSNKYSTNPRLFLGWASKAVMMVGASPKMAQEVGVSGAPNSALTTRIYTTTLMSSLRFASMFQIGASRNFADVAVGSTVSRIVDLDKHNVNFVLENAARQYVLIWDHSKKTAWLVPLICFYLLLLQVYLTKRPGAVLNELPKELYAQIHADGGKEALKTVLYLLSPNINQTIPKTHEADVRTYMEVIQNIVFNFVCHHRDVNNIYEKHRRITPKKILGVELEHLAFCRTAMPVKQAVVNSAWANIALVEPGLVIFCSGLGEAIKASSWEGLCPAWYSVPPDRYYFGVIGHTLLRILQERTVDGKSRLADNIEWTRVNPKMPLIVPHTKYSYGCNHLQWLRTTLREPRGLRGEENILNVISQYLECGFVFATNSSSHRAYIRKEGVNDGAEWREQHRILNTSLIDTATREQVPFGNSSPFTQHSSRALSLQQSSHSHQPQTPLRAPLRPPALPSPSQQQLPLSSENFSYNPEDPESFYRSAYRPNERQYTTDFHQQSRLPLPPPTVHYPRIPIAETPPLDLATRPKSRYYQGSHAYQNPQNGHNAMYQRPLPGIAPLSFPKRAPVRKPIRRPPIPSQKTTDDHSSNTATTLQNTSGSGGSTTSATAIGVSTATASSTGM